MGLRLGLPLCRPHLCSQCGSEVGASGTHGLSCQFSKGRHPHHAAVNDVLKRSLEAAKIPSHLKPSDIFRADGKRPDGVSIVPWVSDLGMHAMSDVGLKIEESVED